MAKSCTKKKAHKKTERVSNIFKTEIKLFHVYVFCCNAAFVYFIFSYKLHSALCTFIMYIMFFQKVK